MRNAVLAMAAATLVTGCSQYKAYSFWPGALRVGECRAYDVRTSHWPWNTIHKFTACRDQDGLHYFPETGSTAGLADMLTAPVGTVLHLPSGGAQQ